MKLRGLIATMLILTAAVVLAQPMPPGGHMRGQAKTGDYLQLSADQIAAWKQITQETMAVVRPLAQQADEVRGQLDAAMKATSPDAAAVGKLALSLHSVREQIRAAQEGARNKRLALLTPEQRTRFDALQAAGGFMRQQRRQRFPGAGR